MRLHKTVPCIIAALFITFPVLAQDSGTAAVLWYDRGDITALDLVGGPGGDEHEPGAMFKFIKESPGGTSPKFDVEDEHGVRWKVKLGEEAKTETAATRLLWAAGYVVDEDYYRSHIRVAGLTLAHGLEFVSDGETVAGARLERMNGTEVSQTWSWYDNQFVGTREFNGLRVMMALLNNWDLKEVNNLATERSGGGKQYRVTDLGATFGRTGNSLNRSKGVLKDYADTTFIEEVTATHVDFGMHSRPFFLSFVNLSNYRVRTRMESIVKRIPISDARWIGDRLGLLSPAQIRDCFRASGFSPDEVESYTSIVMERIAALRKLGVTVALQ